MPFSYVEMMTGFGLADYAELPNFEPTSPAPLTKPLEQSTLSLFSSCGVRTRSQRPFEPLNDLTFRTIPRDVPVSELTFEHPTPVRGFAEQDLNVAYPRDRLVELEAEGVFSRLADNAVSMLGSITTYKELVEQTVPVMAEIFKDQGTDLVLLVPFCPACHRATLLVARALEARGLPCVTLTVLREMAQALKPARPVFLDYPLGATAGRPNDPANQREILRAALTVGAAPETDWRIRDLPFEFAPDGSRAWEDEVRRIYEIKGKEIHRARVAAHIDEGESLVGREQELGIACAC
jgi:D-proline reductase (dithiol) PrdB